MSSEPIGESAISPPSRRAVSARDRPRSRMPARSHRDKRKSKKYLQRPDVVNLHAVQALRASQVDHVVKVSAVFNERIVLNFFMWTKESK